MSRAHKSQRTPNEEQTMNKIVNYINRIITGEPIIANTLTPTHTHTHTNTHTKMHTQTARWSLSRKHTDFPRSKGNLPSLQKTVKGDKGEEL